MADLVEVKLLLEQNDADKLVNLAGGEAQVNHYTTAMIRKLHSDGQASNGDIYVDQALSEAQSLIDQYG
jgi:hypothetical protein